MKNLIITGVFLIFLSVNKTYAQFYVKIRPTYSSHIIVRSGSPPFAGALWLNPEWRWEPYRKCYVEVPGYWVRPHYRQVWRTGHWHYSPMGYEWIPGHWSRW